MSLPLKKVSSNCLQLSVWLPAQRTVDFLCVLGGGGGKKALAYSNTVLNCFIKRAWCWKVKHIPVLYFRDTFVSLCKVLCYSVLKQNAMAIVRGMDLTRISAHHATAFRRYILAILHTKTRTLTEHLKECEVPGCVSAGKTDISCVVCGRWAHRECCNITRGTAYVCIICEAVYGV